MLDESGLRAAARRLQTHLQQHALPCTTFGILPSKMPNEPQEMDARPHTHSVSAVTSCTLIIHWMRVLDLWAETEPSCKELYSSAVVSLVSHALVKLDRSFCRFLIKQVRYPSSSESGVSDSLTKKSIQSSMRH